MVTKKDRRNDGRMSPRLTITAAKQYIIDNCLEPLVYWNDWIEYRDGMRYNSDNTMLRNENMWFSDTLEINKYNDKNKKLLYRRQLMKDCRPVA